jgi:putative hydrolase of the HAD superfamily
MQRALGYGRLFDGAFYSCDLGVLKSSERFFQEVLERLAEPPEEVVVVDDNEEYVAVARRCGLRAVRWTAADGTAALRVALGV